MAGETASVPVVRFSTSSLTVTLHPVLDSNLPAFNLVGALISIKLFSLMIVGRAQVTQPDPC